MSLMADIKQEVPDGWLGPRDGSPRGDGGDMATSRVKAELPWRASGTHEGTTAASHQRAESSPARGNSSRPPHAAFIRTLKPSGNHGDSRAGEDVKGLQPAPDTDAAVHREGDDGEDRLPGYGEHPHPHPPIHRFQPLGDSVQSWQRNTQNDREEPLGTRNSQQAESEDVKPEARRRKNAHAYHRSHGDPPQGGNGDRGSHGDGAGVRKLASYKARDLSDKDPKGSSRRRKDFKRSRSGKALVGSGSPVTCISNSHPASVPVTTDAARPGHAAVKTEACDSGASDGVDDDDSDDMRLDDEDNTPACNDESGTASEGKSDLGVAAVKAEPRWSDSEEDEEDEGAEIEHGGALKRPREEDYDSMEDDGDASSLDQCEDSMGAEEGEGGGEGGRGGGAGEGDGDGRDLPFRCGSCPDCFAEMNDLGSHSYVVHGAAPMFFLCNVCQESFSTLLALSAHVVTHPGVDLKKAKEKKSNGDDAQDQGQGRCQDGLRRRSRGRKKIFPCPLCPKVFGTSSNLGKHKKCHSGVRPHQCPQCPSSFAHSGGLKLHLRTHTGERPFKCTECTASFALSHKLRRHMLTHTGEKPFPCFLCSAAFAVSYQLDRHLKSHTGEKSFACHVCEASFSMSDQLKRHMRIHTGERPFTCSVCALTFTVSSHLKSHMRTHTGEKPYKCHLCQSCFSQSATLTAHMRTHTGEKPFTCDICFASFGGSYNLKRHKRTHTGEKPYTCALCPSSFTSSSNLKVHMKRHVAKPGGVPAVPITSPIPASSLDKSPNPPPFLHHDHDHDHDPTGEHAGGIDPAGTLPMMHGTGVSMPPVFPMMVPSDQATAAAMAAFQLMQAAVRGPDPGDSLPIHPPPRSSPSKGSDPGDSRPTHPPPRSSPSRDETAFVDVPHS